MRRPAVRDSQKLRRAVEAYQARMQARLLALGATKAPGYYDWNLMTPVGPLYISVYDHGIYTSFADPHTAVQFAQVLCNPHSGKWNWPLTRRELRDRAQPEWPFVATLAQVLGSDPATVTWLKRRVIYE